MKLTFIHTHLVDLHSTLLSFLPSLTPPCRYCPYRRAIIALAPTAGYFCHAGTLTTDPSAPTPFKPQPCRWVALLVGPFAWGAWPGTPPPPPPLSPFTTTPSPSHPPPIPPPPSPPPLSTPPPLPSLRSGAFCLGGVARGTVVEWLPLNTLSQPGGMFGYNRPQTCTEGAPPTHPCNHPPPTVAIAIVIAAVAFAVDIAVADYCLVI